MSKTIKTVKQVTQAVRDGWDGEDIIKNAVTPDGESVKSLISKHSYLKQELEDVEKDIAKFAKVVSRGIRELDESDDKEDWGFSYELSGFCVIWQVILGIQTIEAKMVGLIANIKGE